ncbi:hypothetical protein PR048_022808 [Dryococelus australis]|uniref:Uncharacterized protein n=1 Tax=Dryococelus australis TaxID=614101 RepID=A0ABQ9GSC9_9NEOP|nr:hypothetical protein PR048_022808 [Dryococelus australis]
MYRLSAMASMKKPNTMMSKDRWDSRTTSRHGYFSRSPGHSGVVVRLLASLLGKPRSILGEAAPGLSHVGIVPDDASGWRVFSGISCFPHTFVPALLHTPPSSALNISLSWPVSRWAEKSFSGSQSCSTKGERFGRLLTSRSWEPMRVSVEQRWNTRAGGNGRSPRKPADQRYRPAPFLRVKIPGGDPAGNRTRCEANSLTTTPPRPLDCLGLAILPLVHREPSSSPYLDFLFHRVADRDRFPDFRKWELCWTMPQVGRFSRGPPVFLRPCIPAPLHAHLASPSSALNTSINGVPLPSHPQSRKVGKHYKLSLTQRQEYQHQFEIVTPPPHPRMAGQPSSRLTISLLY